jgi:acyl transferase domain-containing protein/NAD(P)-dependent dehydrogenase (short-subunit alcohol dehydrogenase family)/acyl carrier protein
MNEPIAIIGMGCRFPGAPSPEAYWQLLTSGGDALRFTPPERWSLNRFHDPDVRIPGKVITRRGGYLEQIDRFDARFFGISPREANCLDPQQRLLLELSWETLEDAGIVPATLAGGNVGVFVGAFTMDYMLMQLNTENRALIQTHTATGSMMTMISNRISYAFDFRGPSLSVDTACSSSLVAVHLACQNLQAGDCELAIAGGVNVIIKPEFTIAESKGGFLSPDGASKAFSRTANGYVRGEGAGLVLLKPLSKAVADGDPIYAIIRGSAVNQDGHSNGITVPRQEAQETLIREACRKAILTPADIQYVEAHGTGTPVGDPIEARAIGTVMSEGRPKGEPCIMGSAKTNIGHLEAAAGVAGLIKATLALTHRAIPPTLYADDPNPAIPFGDLSLRVPASLEAWPETDGPARAGVNSFGFGGTNAHVIVEEMPGRQAAVSAAVAHADVEGPIVIPVSAKSPEGLKATAAALSAFVKTKPASIRDIAYTSAVRRTHHSHRAAVVAASRTELCERLDAFVAGENPAGFASATHTGVTAPRLVFVFTGMGPQWWAMGRQLYQSEPVFRSAVQRCDEEFRAVAGWSIVDALLADESASRMSETEIAQPANFVVQVGLTELWKSWGVVPEAIVGHSVGEVAAAYVSGALSLADAITVSYHRSRLQQTAAGRGAMMAAGIGPEQAEEMLAPFAGRISIAAVNSANSTTLSGDPDALQELSQILQSNNTFCRFLRVNVAYHSHHMDPLRDEVMSSLASLNPRLPEIPLYSTVTGERADMLPFDAQYWWENVRQPVVFGKALETLIGDGYNMFLEVGPNPVLAASISEGLANSGKEGSVHCSLRRGDAEMPRMLTSLGELHCKGYFVGWKQVYPAGRLVKLPAYAWQRERYWNESEVAECDRLGPQVHPLLGHRSESPVPAWHVELSSRNLAYLPDHRVHGATVYPGAGYIEMAIAAAREFYGTQAVTLEDIRFAKALFLPEGEIPVAETVVHPETAAFEIFSRGTTSAWSLHAAGKLVQRRSPLSVRIPLDSIRSRCSTESGATASYEEFSRKGFAYGPAFQRITHLSVGSGEALAEIKDAENAEEYNLHPTILDACFQTIIALDPFQSADKPSPAYLPVGIDSIRFYRKPEGRMFAYARLVAKHDEDASGDVVLSDEHGEVFVEVRGFKVQLLESSEAKRSAESLDRWLYEMAWKPAAAMADSKVPDAKKPGMWLVFQDTTGVGESLISMLEQRGETCVSVASGHKGDLDYEQLVDEITARAERAGAGLVGVIHLWSLDADPTEKLSADSLRTAQQSGCLSVFHLSRAMANCGKAFRLWLVTRGAQSTGLEEAAPSIGQASVWGIGRVIGHQELLAFGSRLIDMDPDAATPEGDTALLLEDILQPGDEDQMSYRSGMRFVPRLVRADDLEAALPARFRSDASYLITGAFGALGMLTARNMIERGARRLVLIGRSKLPPRSQWNEVTDPAIQDRIRAIRDLEARGASIHVVDRDVADQAAMAAFYEEYQRDGYPQIRGVIHAAGVVRDRLLQQMDQKTFEEVLNPKVMGAWVLSRLFENTPLDFFILFSSTGSVVASAGQANYASGNAFMDALAHYRRKQGLAGLAINWGPWAVGMVRDLGLIEHYTRMGLEPIGPQAGMQVFEKLLGQKVPQVVVLSADWPTVLGTRQRIPRMFDDLAQEQNDALAETASSNDQNAAEQIMLADSADRRQMLEEHLREIAARVLRTDSSSLDLAQPLNALGLDSMMAMELKTRIDLSLDVTVPILDLLKGSSIADVAAPILAQLNERAELMAEVLNEMEDVRKY